MATSQDDRGRRKKSRSSEGEEGRKRRKEDEKSKNKRSKSKRSRRDGAASDKKKFKSISELVKLVIAGEVEVPKSLTHYVSDRNQLLDQVFTILSEGDVRGMLPDILKGLKVKHVRQLCLEQLKSMSEEELVESLEDSQPSAPALNVDTTVFRLLESEAGREDGGGRGGSVHGSDPAEQGREDMSGSDRKMNIEDGGFSLEDQAPSLPREVEEEEEESRMCVSDVSEEEGVATSSVVDMAIREGGRTQSSPTLTMECDTTTSELNSDCRASEDGGGEEDEEGEEEEEEEEGVGSEESMSTGSGSSLGDLDDFWLCEFPDEVTEWARLREIEFRQRALEAELRRRGEMSDKLAEDEDREEEKVSVCDKMSDISSQETAHKLDKSKAIEVQLRQRALQSLLAKKKEQSL